MVVGMDTAYTRISAVLHRGSLDLGSWLVFHCDGLQPSSIGCLPVISGWAQCPAADVWMRRFTRNEAGSPLGGED